MSNVHSEMIAINAVKRAILNSPILVPYISENDKTPSWDGNILVYLSADSNKNTIKGMVPVQVKGKQVKSLSEKTISHPIKIVDLRNYLNTVGCLYFVVHIVNNNTEIYYANLLPIDIKEILSNAKAKSSSVSVSLKKLDVTSSNHIESICNNFLLHRDLQNPNKCCELPTPLKDFKSFEITSFVKSLDTNPFLPGNETYLYGKENDNLLIPLGKIQIEKITGTHPNQEVSIGDRVYFNQVAITMLIDGGYVTIGKNINYNANGQFTYHGLGCLEERLRDVEFLVAISESNYFFINEMRFEFHAPQKDIEFINSYFKYLKDMKALFSFFNVNQKVEMDLFVEQDYTDLEWLINTVLYNKKSKLDDIVTPGVTSVRVGNIVLYILITLDNSGFASIENLFSDTVKRYKCGMTFKNNNKTTESSLYMVLVSKDLVRASNLNLQIILDSIKLYTLNEVYIEQVNKFILELIVSYDVTVRSEFLTSAINLCEWLEKYDDVSVIWKLNRLQIFKRLRSLSDDEIQLLIDIRNLNLNDIQIQCAVNILLGNNVEFKYYFGKLSDTEKDSFSTYPIYNLYRQFATTARG